MRKNQKEFLIELGGEMQEVQKVFPELFPVNLTPGWYVKKWNAGYIDIFLVNQTTSLKFICSNYFRNKQIFTHFANTKLNISDFKDSRKATYKEVLDILEIEAIRRGFKKGCIHTMTNYEGEVIARDNYFGFDLHWNKLMFNNQCIMQKGEWSKVLQKAYTIQEAQKEFGIQIITHF